MISLFRDKLEFVGLVFLDFFAFYVTFKCKIQPINVYLKPQFAPCPAVILIDT